MANPFPGVNPQIEATGDRWVGFHNRLITHMSEMLNAGLLPRGYAAVVGKRMDLIDVSFDHDQRLPDASPSRSSRCASCPGSGS